MKDHMPQLPCTGWLPLWYTMKEKDWDKVAATFDEEILNVPAHDWRGMVAAFVQQHGGPSLSAADMGCGIGRTLPLLAAHFGTVHALDFSSNCLAIAESTNALHGNIHYHHVDMTVGPVPFAPVDLVLCINAWLMHEPDQRDAAIRHTLQSIKPGGHLLLVTPSLERSLFTTHRLVQWQRELGHSPRVAQQKAAKPMSDLDMGVVVVDGVSTKHFLKEELEDILHWNGLKILSIRKLEYPWDKVFSDPPEWMGPPMPWNWLVTAKKP